MVCKSRATASFDFAMPPKPEVNGDGSTPAQAQGAIKQPELIQIPINIPLLPKLEFTGNLVK